MSMDLIDWQQSAGGKHDHQKYTPLKLIWE